jgi:hypothetical protein
MARNVDAILAHLDDTRGRLLASITDLSPEAFARRPAANAWSTAEVLDHLAILEASLVPLFRDLIEGRRKPKIGLFDRLRRLPPSLTVHRFVKGRAPKRVEPGAIQSRETLLGRLADSRSALRSLIEDSRSRDLSGLAWVHFIFGALRLDDWFYFIGYHEERHRRQIAEIRNSLGA